MTWHVVGVDLPPETVGGVASWTADAAAALAAAGERVVLYGRRDGDTALWDDARDHPVVRMRGRSWLRRQAEWAALWVGPRLQRGDRLLCATWRVARWLAPLAARREIKIGVAAHGSELTKLETAPPALLQLGPAVTWFPVSHFLSQELARLGGEGWSRHVLPIPLLVNPVHEPTAQSGLVYVARPTPLKGIERAIKMSSLLQEPLTLIGPTRDDLPRDLPDHVNATGPLSRDAVLNALARHKAALLLPRTAPDGFGAEGLGISLLEAAAAGVQTIGCRTGGVPEAVGPGLILDDPDAPDLSVVRDWLERPDAGSEAKAWVQRTHGPVRFVRALQQVFR